ncbi:MAG TPA: DUF2442 domain-containing protein [bacterium]|nr:DUF2442 domain-containing protein [bacterium]
MYAGVSKIKDFMPDYKMLILFDNGEEKIFDMNPYLSLGLFSELKDVQLFKTAKVVFDSIEWANGADISPIILYEEGIPVKKAS